MDRRTFLKTTTVAAGSSLALSTTPAGAGDHEPAAPALSRSIRKLTFAAAWAPDVPVLGDAGQRLRQRLGHVLHGSCHLAQADAPESADLRLGPVSVEHDPVFAFFAGLPGSYGLEPAQLQAWLAVGGGQMLWDDIAAQYGFKPLLAGHTGVRPGLWSTRRLESVADFKDATVALPGIGPSIARQLGAAVPARIPPSDWASALADGRVGAIECGSPLAGLMLRLPQSAAHYYRDGIHRNGIANVLTVRLATWEHLDAATRVGLENLAAHELATSLAESLAHARIAREAIASTPTLEVADLSSALVARIDEATAAVLDEIGASGPDAVRIRDSYLSFRQLLTAPMSGPEVA